jgi:hypothetical protein
MPPVPFPCSSTIPHASLPIPNDSAATRGLALSGWPLKKGTGFGLNSRANREFASREVPVPRLQHSALLMRPDAPGPRLPSFSSDRERRSLTKGASAQLDPRASGEIACRKPTLSIFSTRGGSRIKRATRTVYLRKCS